MFESSDFVSGDEEMTEFDETYLREFGEVLERILAGESLSEEEAYEVFLQVLSNKQPALNQGALLAALRGKGESIEEIAGCWRAIMQADTVKVRFDDGKTLVENCGTGMDRIKTFNISTAAAIVAASLGVPMARHGARAITSRAGTVDIAEALGVDVECGVDVVKSSIEQANLGLFNGMSARVHPGGLFRILKYVRFGSILNISASLANPATPTLGARGVCDQAMLKDVALLMRRLGYRKGIVYTGLDMNGEGSMDEVSILGLTRVVEFSESTMDSYEITPEVMNIKRGTYDDVKPMGDLESEVIEFLKAFVQPSKSSRVDAICANTAPVLYVYGMTGSFSEGAAMARESIESGHALEQLKLWVQTQNTMPEKGMEKLEKYLSLI